LVIPPPPEVTVTGDSPWIELKLDPVPLDTESDVHQAINFLTSVDGFYGAPPWTVVFVRAAFGAVIDPEFDPADMYVPHGAARPGPKTPVVLIKATSDADLPAPSGETLVMLDATNSNILYEFTLRADGDPSRLDTTDWGRYGRLVTLKCDRDVCLCRPKACAE